MNSSLLTFPHRWPVFNNWSATVLFWTAIGLLFICFLGPHKVDMIQDVPITLQTLVVMLLPILWGTQIGVIVVAGYLLLGALGLPVFSGGGHGWAVFAGPTGGFLIGFLPATLVTGMMVHSRWGNKWLAIGLAILVGHQIVLMVGLPWYGWQKGWDLVPSLWASLTPGMLVKVILGMLLAGGLRWVMAQKNRKQNASG